MNNSEKIAEIKKLSEELRDFKQERNIYKVTESKLRKMAEEVEILRNRRKEIDLQSVKDEIRNLEREYERICLEIECLTMKEKECLSIRDLEMVYKNISDDNICMEKAFKYLETLIITNEVNVENINNGFRLCESEEGTILVIKISCDVEGILRLSKKKSFFSKILLEWRSLVKRELEESVAQNCSFYKSENHFYIVVRENIESNRSESNMEGIYFEKVCKIDVRTMAEEMGNAWNTIFLVLKDNLGKKMIRNRYEIEKIRENNNVFRNSEWYIEDLDEWILDVVMKNILRIPLKNNTEDEWKEKNNQKVYSESYEQLIGCLSLFGQIRSNRMSKARDKIKSVIFDYFKRECTLFPEQIFSRYAELFDFIKNEKGIRYLGELENGKELEDEKYNIFCKILKKATYIDADLSKAPLVVKSELRTLLYDFTENINKFVESSERKEFITGFFRELYANLFELALKPKKYTIQEKNCFCDVVKYAIDLSYENNLRNLEEYDKLSQCLRTINTCIEDIGNIYTKELTKLSKYELRTIIRMFFDKDEKRDELLDKIY